MGTRIAHISDLHLLDLEGATVLSFLNKRLTGGANLLLKRARTHQQEIVERALDELWEADIDHLVVTGDLTNLALDAEFRLARRLLDRFGGADRVSIVPGNHDRYTYRSARNKVFEHHFESQLRSDRPQLIKNGAFPYVKLLPEVAVIGLSSAVPTPPIFATGTIGRAQMTALRALLDDPDVVKRFVLVLLHHHPVKLQYRRFDRMRRLTDASELVEVLRSGRADLVVHGHNHRPAFTELPFDDGTGALRIVEAGSTSAVQHGPEDHAGKYNIYEIDGGRLTRFTRFSYIGPRCEQDDPRGTFKRYRTREFAE